jgi:Cu/Ag efflux protein CusF
MSNRILFIVSAAAVCTFTLSAASFAAEAKKAVPPAAPAAAKQMPKPAFNTIGGTVVKIDTVDPANAKIEVKNDADGAVHLISVTPMTNINKVTDISELKAGDAVRVYSKKSDGNEIAMGIIFGKLAAHPVPRPPAKSAARSPEPVEGPLTPAKR